MSSSFLQTYKDSTQNASNLTSTPVRPRRNKHVLEDTMDDIKMENSLLREQLSVLKDLDGPNVAEGIVKLNKQLKRCMRENEKLKAELAEARKHQKDPNITGSTTSIDTKSDASRSPISRRKCLSPMINASITDLEELRINYHGFRSICQQMFIKLQGTAAFMDHLIRSLESDSEDPESRQLLAKIKAIQLDLSGSMKDTSLMMKNVDQAEKSMTALEQNGRISLGMDISQSLCGSEDFHRQSVLAKEEVQKFNHTITSLQTSLTQKEAYIQDLEKQCNALQDNCTEMETLALARNRTIEEIEDKLTIMKVQNGKLGEAIKTYQANEIKYQDEIKRLKAVASDIHTVTSEIQAQTATQHVPNILSEMSNIYQTLSTVQTEMKKLSKIKSNSRSLAPVAKSSKKPEKDV